MNFGFRFFLVGKVNDGRYAVRDLNDDSTEFLSELKLLKYSNIVKIAGVDGGIIDVDWHRAWLSKLSLTYDVQSVQFGIDFGFIYFNKNWVLFEYNGEVRLTFAEFMTSCGVAVVCRSQLSTKSLSAKFYNKVLSSLVGFKSLKFGNTPYLGVLDNYALEHTDFLNYRGIDIDAIYIDDTSTIVNLCDCNLGSINFDKLVVSCSSLIFDCDISARSIAISSKSIRFTENASLGSCVISPSLLDKGKLCLFDSYNILNKILNQVGILDRKYAIKVGREEKRIVKLIGRNQYTDVLDCDFYVLGSVPCIRITRRIYEMLNEDEFGVRHGISIEDFKDKCILYN